MHKQISRVISGGTSLFLVEIDMLIYLVGIKFRRCCQKTSDQVWNEGIYAIKT